MNPPAPALSRLIEPLRDLAIGGILEAMARELEADAEVVPEPELRDALKEAREQAKRRLKR